jgi:hypothetical protein
MRHMNPNQTGSKNHRFKWNFQALQQEALKYSTRHQFSKKSNWAYKVARKLQILNKICSHMMSPHRSWTYELIHEEALKYKSRGEFAKNSTKAYDMAIYRGILDQICCHMNDQRHFWTDEEIQKTALEYKSRGEFYSKNPNAYEVARNRKILDRVCFQMKPSGYASIPEKELFSLIKNIFPKVEKYHDRGVKIQGKPHIRGFDIDALVGKLGIEFDGTYHHSFNGLKRSRHHWPDEDIHNYHEIKDAWFASKGIQVLHIREEDWIKDKQACVDRCLAFLSQK